MKKLGFATYLVKLNGMGIKSTTKFDKEDLVDAELPSVSRKPHHYYW